MRPTKIKFSQNPGAPTKDFPFVFDIQDFTQINSVQAVINSPFGLATTEQRHVKRKRKLQAISNIAYRFYVILPKASNFDGLAEISNKIELMDGQGGALLVRSLEVTGTENIQQTRYSCIATIEEPDNISVLDYVSQYQTQNTLEFNGITLETPFQPVRGPSEPTATEARDSNNIRLQTSFIDFVQFEVYLILTDEDFEKLQRNITNSMSFVGGHLQGVTFTYVDANGFTQTINAIDTPDVEVIEVESLTSRKFVKVGLRADVRYNEFGT